MKFTEAQLKERVEQLSVMLNDLHPGLSTWCAAIQRVGSDVRDGLAERLGSPKTEKASCEAE